MQLRVGLMVLFTAIIIVILLMTFGGQDSLFRHFQRNQVFHVQFPEAPQVTVDTPVQKSGIRIGRVTRVRLADEVTDIEMDPETGVVITVEIDRDRKIFSDEVCRIKRNLLGDAVLEFVRSEADEAEDRDPSGELGAPDQDSAQADALGAPSDDPFRHAQVSPEGKPREVIESGAVLRGKVQADPIQVVGNLKEGLADAIKSVAETSDEIRDFVEKVSGFLGPVEELGPKQERLRNILQTSLETMGEMKQLAENANRLIGNEELQADIREMVAEAPKVVRGAGETLDQMKHTFQTMDETVRRVNVSLGNIENFAQRLDEKGGTMIERLDRSSVTLELLMGELLTLTTAVNSQEGTLGRLVRDPELYDNLNDAVTNIEDVSRRLRPVVDNARVFSDKIARHPEILGVRGALQQSPGTKGVPSLSQLRGTAGLSPPPNYPRFTQPQR